MFPVSFPGTTLSLRCFYFTIFLPCGVGLIKSEVPYIDTPHNWVATEEKSFLESLYTSPEKFKQMKARREKAYRDRRSCPMPFTTLAIRADGMVSPCCIDWMGGTNLASLEDMSLWEVWEGFSMYAFRKMQLEGRNQENPSCRNCEFYKSSYYMLDDIDGFPVEKLGTPPKAAAEKE